MELCNYDCFRCPYADCKQSMVRLTAWERRVLREAHNDESESARRYRERYRRRRERGKEGREAEV